MSIHRYRSVADMPRVPRAEPDELGARIRAVWTRAHRICALSPPRGVRRFASIEAANEARNAATIERMRKTARRT